MESSPFQTQVKAIFVFLVAIGVAVYAGLAIGSEEYLSLLIAAVILLGCWLWFFSGRLFWVLTIASSFLVGTFPILRGQFTPFQLLMAMGLVKFLIEDVVFRRVRLQLPGRFDLLMIAGFMAVITIHAVHDRFGMRFLGSTIWGGRYYVNCFVGLAAFFVIQSIPTKLDLWGKFPYAVLGVATFDLFIATLTTLLPASIYIIYPFYSAVSVSSLQDVIGDAVDITGRIAAFGNFGVFLLTVILARTSLRSILHPSNVGRIFGVLIGSVSVLLSGFRSAVLNAFLLVVLAGIRDLRAAALTLLPIIAAAFFCLSAINSEVVRLPKQIQRGLAFLPGNWDSDMASDAKASNEFRFEVWNLWWHQYFPQKPILGRGFGFNGEWTKRSIYYGNSPDHRQMVETGNIHNGFLAGLDTFGIVGTLFFVTWNIALLTRALQVPFSREGGAHFALRFIALCLAVQILSYWIGAANVGSFLPQEFALAGVFLRLRASVKAAEVPRRQVTTARELTGKRQLARA